MNRPATAAKRTLRNLIYISRLFCLLLLVQLAATTAPGADWFLDPAATGANNGSSWSAAWKNPTNVNWNSVNPGDTVYVSGGTTSQVYTNWLTIGKNGTPGNYITLKIGQDPGHNGKAIFDGCAVGMSSTAQWNAIDGGRSSSFVTPTNHEQVIKGSTAITNNIGFVCRNIIGTNDNEFSPCWLYFSQPNNLRVSWVEATGFTNRVKFDDGQIIAGNINGGNCTNIVFQYLYVHDNGGCQVVWGGQQATSFDNVVFQYIFMDWNVEDYFRISGGFSIHDSVIGRTDGASDHTDLFQITGNYFKIYNNDIRESENSIFRIQNLAGAPTYTNVMHDVWFFNNIFSEKEGRGAGGTWDEPGCIVNFDPLHPAGLQVYSNIIIANNLWYNTVTNHIFMPGATPDGLPINSTIYWSKGGATVVTNAYITNCLFVNNLFIDRQKGVNMAASTKLIGAEGYWPYRNDAHGLLFDYNVMANTNTYISNARRLSYMDVTADLEVHPFKMSNKTNYPVFVAPYSDNYELQATTPAGINDGYNMSAYFNFDGLNRPRNVGGAWDRGPLEYQGGGSTGTLTSGLLVWLTFDDDFSDNKLDDSSGNGNHAWRFGRIGSSYPTNFPKQILSSTTPGRTNLSSGDYCGKFDWYPTGYGLYGREGDYAAITNTASLTNMATATIMCWARYYPSHPGLDYSSDANETLLSAGVSAGVVGSWGFGRDNDNIWLNNTRFYVLTNSSTWNYSILEFPENGYNDDSINWTHYAMTWNNGVMVAYMNGVAVRTNDCSAATTRLQIGRNPNAPYSWIGVGCDTHGGTPALNDEAPNIEYPNNGFLNGVMDDVRIYNRALNPSEIQSIYSPASQQGQQKPVGPTRLRIQ